MPVQRPARRRIAATVAAVLALAAGPAGAEDAPLRPRGVGADDPRGTVDPAQAPWNSLVKVQTNLAGSCTGVLVAPRRVLTAAHCLFNRKTRALFPAQSLHALFGYQRGEYSLHRGVARYVVDPLYDGRRPGAMLGRDWAVLVLDGDAPPGLPMLPVAGAAPAAGSAIMMAGYNQDRVHVLMADRHCSAGKLAADAGLPVLLHDCSGTFGTSGAPLLQAAGGRWQVVGITVAGIGDGRQKAAVPPAAFRGAVTAP
jgi:protease YdgD